MIISKPSYWFQYTIMIMCLDGKNAYKPYPIMDGGVGVKKTRDNRDRSNNAPISSDYLKLLCDLALLT